MNDIKFRAYHSKYGLGRVISMSFYEKTKEYNSDTECYAYYPKMNHSLLTSYSEVQIMQYTGLKDKNGVEIYEGDIIQISDDCNVWGMNSGEIYEVYFGFGGFRMRPKYNKNSRGYYAVEENELEVIGNIYENPELLEGLQ